VEYPLLPRDDEEMNRFVENIAQGNRDEIHQILLFCLDNQDDCREKIYLASFLSHIEFPLDTQYSEHEEETFEQVDRYHQLQKEFKESYNLYLVAKKNNENIREAIDDTDVESVKNEKNQLLERIKEVEEGLLKHKRDDSFFDMLRVTKSLKKEKEEENRLENHSKEQHGFLQFWEQKLKDLQNSCNSNCMWDINEETLCMELLLKKVRDEIRDLKILLKSDLEPIRCELEEKVQKQELSSSRPRCISQDLLFKLEQKEIVQEEINKKSKLLHVEQAKETYPKVELYYQHTMVSKQSLGAKHKSLEQSKKNFEAKLRTITKLQYYVDNIQRPIGAESETIELPDGTVLNNNDARTYLKQSQDIIKQKEEREVQLDRIKEENLALRETLKSLSRDKFGSNIDDILEAREKMQTIDKESKEINTVKGQTLQEISEIVTEMTETLKKERENLEPMIKELKAKRGQYTEIKQVFDDKRARHEDLKMKLAKDRKDLEHDHDQHQKRWKQREREYHRFYSLNEILKVTRKRTKLEEEWRSGSAQIRQDFEFMGDFYERKLAQDGNLEKTLRLEQKKMKAHELENLKQKRMFFQLRKLLGLKLRLGSKDLASKSDQSINVNSITLYT